MNQKTGKILYALLMAGLFFSAAGWSADLLIDVRSEAEYGESHIAGAINIPLAQLGDMIGKIAPDKKTPIKLYCRSGRRSALAREILEKMGYLNIADLGGMNDARKLLKQGK